MHAPLGTAERQLACAELISALEQCHAKGMIAKLSGVCNEQKEALSMCLRKERLDRTARNREAAKDRTAKKKEVWAALEREKADEKV
ncbi:hypothetical protein I317_06229 [Kwoniella heveanensis CBS 569]|uniref:COX assembly mitochondrial protein n=1 Tax=Kwoniella heveanensis BCC8398 TaxID=1296120 RepID=A0A1B9H3T8_9TREE|nr:hypothetical protein I316_00151 [Kwoniella heveanensis BCC8398]OCF39975.1 hypothetical protein I317_06229 [Kwoniella heveanensis CBS 569]